MNLKKYSSILCSIGLLLFSSVLFAATTTLTGVAIKNSSMSSSTINGTTIGATLASTGNFLNLQIGSGTVLTGTRGNSAVVQESGTIVAGKLICADANQNTTTVGCPISTGTNSSVCSTTTGAGNTCTTTITITPTQADTAYIPSCTGVGVSGAPYIAGVSKATGSITVTISNGQGSQAVVSTYSEVDCSAIHP